MKRATSPFFQDITKNWHIKLICLLVAIIIYIAGYYSINRPRIVSVPVTVFLPQEYEPQSNLPDSVSLSISGSGDSIYLIDPSLIRATVDFSNIISPGVHVATVDLQYDKGILRDGVIAITPNPYTFRVLFNKKGTSQAEPTTVEVNR